MSALRINPDVQLSVATAGHVVARNHASGDVLELTPDVLIVLREFVEPSEPSAVRRALMKRFDISAVELDGVLQQLMRAAVLIRPGRRPGKSVYFDDYGDLDVHRAMVGDHARTDAFRRAIDAVVKRGARVLDIGCGTGILSLFAARAGASRVDAVDAAEIIALAARVAADNQLGRRIHFHRGTIDTVRLSGRYDVIVSEWLGHFAVQENMFTSVFTARDRLLVPGGSMIPALVELQLAPIEDSSLHSRFGPGLWERPLFGFDLSALADATLRMPTGHPANVQPQSYLSDPACLVRVDCTADQPDAFHHEAAVVFKLQRSGMLHGFAGHFSCELGGGVVLDTSPWSRPTHWRQYFLPTAALPVVRGDTLEVELKIVAMQPGQRIPVILLRYRHRRGRKRLGDASLVYDAQS